MQILLKQTWNLLRKKALHKNMDKIQETYVQTCENSSDLPTRKLKRKLSHLGQIVNIKDRTFIVGSGASLPVMGKNEVTSGEGTIRRYR